MRTGVLVVALSLVAMPSTALARGGHHGLFGGHHGHSINAWTGSHRPRLR